MEQNSSDLNQRSMQQPQTFAAAVTTARTKRKMSRDALAEQTGASRQVVEDLERGYPVAQYVVAAVCRNLDLPEPPLDSDPLVRLALLVRERRGRARFSRPQLGEKVGVTAKTIKSIETASHWPNQETCMRLLAVKALQLQEADVAAFIGPLAAGEVRREPGSSDDYHFGRPGTEASPIPEASPSAEASPVTRAASVDAPAPIAGTAPVAADSAAPQPSADRSFKPDASPPTRARRRTGPSPVAAVWVRVFADGKVRITVHPCSSAPSQISLHTVEPKSAR